MLGKILRRLAWWRKRETVHAIHGDDLVEILQGIGLLEPIKNEEVSCYKCERTITKDNVTHIFKTEEGFKLYCDRITCRQSAIKHQEEGE